MKIGACGGILGATYPIAKELGFDYFETAFRDFSKMSEDEFQKCLETVKEVGLPVIRANGLFFNEQHFFGEGAMTEEEFKSLLEIGFERASKVGVETVVWGAGPTRKIPEGTDKDEAMKIVFRYGNFIADMAKKYGMQIAIEPLCRYETNVFNTVKDSCEFLKKLNRPEVMVLADSYHMMVECEKYGTLGNYADMLIHAHIAEAKYDCKDIRLTPNMADENNVKEFIYELKKMGYDGTVSIEAGLRSGDWKKDMTEGLEAIRKWANE